MYSKAYWKILLAAFSIGAMALAGCESKIGEEPPKEEVQEFSGTQCLSDAKPVFQRYTKGEATPAEMHRSWDCIVVALDKFKKYVRGSDREKFTPQELATFLETNFMEDSGKQKFSPQLQTEIMKFKGLLIGGSHNHLTILEIDKIVKLIGEFRTISIDILPYMNVISMEWKPKKFPVTSAELAYFESANLALQKAAKQLSEVIEANGQSYVIADFAVLLEEFGKSFGEEWASPDFVRKYLPVIKKIKKAVAGGDESAIVPSEWRRFTLLGARGFVQFLRYDIFIKNLPASEKKLRTTFINKVIEDSLSAVEDILEEKPSSVIDKGELYDLIQAFKYVRPDVKMSEGFFNELLKLKVLIVGGSETAIAGKDIVVLKNKVPKIFNLVDDIDPHLSILTQNWEPTKSSFENAQKTLKTTNSFFVNWLGDALSLVDGGYDLNSLPKLISEYEKLYGNSKTRWSKEVNTYLPLIIKIKKMMFGDDSSLIKKSQWRNSAQIVSGAYGEFLYYNYFVKDRNLQKAQGISAFSNLGHSVIDFLKNLVRLKHNEFFAREELLSIINFLAQQGNIPSFFSGSIADQSLEFVLNNVLVTPERRLAGKKPNALNISALDTARTEFTTWMDVEILWVRVASGWTNPNSGYMPHQLTSYLREVAGSKNSSEALKLGMKELRLSTEDAYPIVTDERGFVKINYQGDLLYTFKALRDLNRNRMVARILIRAFGNDLGRINSYTGVNLKEVENGFNRLKGIFIKIGLLDPNNKTFVISRFREANIFTPHADGNNLVSHAELTDLVGMIFSGIGIYEKLKPSLLKTCFSRNAIINDSSMVSVECAKSAYKPAMARIMTTLPEYLGYMRRVGDATWSNYMQNIFLAAGYITNAKGTAKLGDIALTPHVIQYIEMIFARYDLNRDALISTHEAIRAYPSFDALMKEIAGDMIRNGDIKESELIDIFAFILKYGHPPTGVKEKTKYFFSWKGKSEKWELAADRTQLALILGFIASQTTPAP